MNVSAVAEDYPRTLQEFEGRSATEQACREYLMQLRGPGGLRVPAVADSDLDPVGGACRAVENAIIRLR